MQPYVQHTASPNASPSHSDGFSGPTGIGSSHESEAQYALDASHHAFRLEVRDSTISTAWLGPKLGRPAKLPHIATMEDEADTPTERHPLATQGTRYSAVADEANTPTEHRPLVSRGTRCGRAVVAGAALLSSGVMLSSRTRTNLAVESGAQPTGDPCYVDGTEDFPQGLQNLAGYETLG